MTELERWTKILKILRNLRKSLKNNTHESDLGICDVLESGLPGSSDDIMRFYKSWEHWTGSTTYPVPAHAGNKTRHSAEDIFMDSRPMHMWYVGEYAEMRRDLLKHLIKKTKSRVKRLEKDNGKREYPPYDIAGHSTLGVGIGQGECRIPKEGQHTPACLRNEICYFDLEHNRVSPTGNVENE